MSDGCGRGAAEAKGSGTNMAILLHWFRRFHRWVVTAARACDSVVTVALCRRQSPLATWRETQSRALRSDHTLLVERLQIPDHLRDHPDQLARDVSDILLGQLPLLLLS